MEKIDLKELASFLVKAKVGTYASHNSDKIVSQRPGFQELEFKEMPWYYRDSYAGFFSAPGQEIVYFNGTPIWAMAYSGGMLSKYQKDVEFAKQTFGVLKEALKKVPLAKPFRGPAKLIVGEFKYTSKVKGTIASFSGHEEVTFKGKKVFEQDYIGGLIIEK